MNRRTRGVQANGTIGAPGRDQRRVLHVDHAPVLAGKLQDLDLLLDLSENMTGKTICVLSDSCAAPVVSGIKKFRNEFEDYIAGRRRAMVA